MKKIFCLLLVLFLFIFSDGLSIKATQYVVGGVNIDKDWGHKSLDSLTGFDSLYGSNKVYRVTDLGRLASNQPEFIIDLTDFGLSEQGLYYGAYRTVVVIFQITMKEVSDGYQEIYLINTSETVKGDLATPITNFEHGAGYLDNTYKRYEFYAEFTGKALCSKELSISFSAHGAFNDDWLVGNVEVQICTSSEAKKITSIKFIENAIVDPCWP